MLVIGIMRSIKIRTIIRMTIIVCVLFFLAGCSMTHRQSQIENRISQITLANHTFTVEIADTDSERRIGLMNRTELPADHGMLFVFDEPQQVSFWMKNTLIPLDILYFDADNKLTQIYANTPPCNPEPVEGCPTYQSRSNAIQYALELPTGTATQIGAKIDDEFKMLPVK